MCYSATENNIGSSLSDGPPIAARHNRVTGSLLLLVTKRRRTKKIAGTVKKNGSQITKLQWWQVFFFFSFFFFSPRVIIELTPFPRARNIRLHRFLSAINLPETLPLLPVYVLVLYCTRDACMIIYAVHQHQKNPLEILFANSPFFAPKDGLLKGHLKKKKKKFRNHVTKLKRSRICKYLLNCRLSFY